MSSLLDKRRDLDAVDKMIFDEGLRIRSVHVDQEFDLMLIILSNKKILKRKLGITARLKNANEAQLKNFTISRTGIHWPELDEDLSLRSFLKEEMLNAIKKDFSLAD